MTRYASGTDVSAERTQTEIERTLQRYGADQFARGWNGESAFVAFRLKVRAYRMVITMPDRKNREFTHTPERGWAREPKAARAAWEQACRQRWRALLLYIKATLEAAESGIITIEEGFLPALILPGGQTFGEWAEAQVGALAAGEMPRLLLPSKRSDSR